MEDRSIFLRMMIICKARPEIDIKEAVGEYEFSIVPGSMFPADGTMLHCSSKSTFMNFLEMDEMDPRRNTEGSALKRFCPLLLGWHLHRRSLLQKQWQRFRHLTNQTGLIAVPNLLSISSCTSLRSTMTAMNCELSLTDY